MQHNITSHGYGIMRETRVTPRAPGMVTGKTALSANLGPVPAVMNATETELSRQARPSFSESYKLPLPLGWTKADLEPRRAPTPVPNAVPTAPNGTHSPKPHTQSLRPSSTVARPSVVTVARTPTGARTTSTREVTSAERDAVILQWAERAERSPFPTNYVRRNVPRVFRQEVTALLSH